MPMLSNQIVKGSAQKPLQVNAGKDLTGDIYLAHREFVCNVTVQAPNGTPGPTVSLFQNNVLSFPINAALTQTFPWLSQTAQNWVLYEFQGLIFEYRPTSGEYGNLNSNVLGKVIMATQYDPDAPAFTTSTQMENYDYATSCKPAEHMIHGVETKHLQRATNMLYTRTGASSKDKIFTDLGTFQIATEGVPITCTAGSGFTQINIGELWVTYKVKLSRANLFGTQLALSCPVDNFYGQGSVASNAFNLASTAIAGMASKTASIASAYNTSNLGAGLLVPKFSNNIGCTVSAVANTAGGVLITFPSNLVNNVYRITYQVSSESTNSGFGTVGAFTTTLTNCTAITNGTDAGFWSPMKGTIADTDNTSETVTVVLLIQLNAPGNLVASVQLNPPSPSATYSPGATAVIDASITIAQVPSTYATGLFVF